MNHDFIDIPRMAEQSDDEEQSFELEEIGLEALKGIAGGCGDGKGDA